MQRIRLIPLLSLFIACGGGSTPPLPPVLTAISGPFDPLFSAALVLTGKRLPGEDGELVRIVLTPVPPIDANTCVGDSQEVEGTRISETEIRALSPTFPWVGSMAMTVRAVFEDGTELVAPNELLAQFSAPPDVQLDQDSDGATDSCDPRTYDFERDTLGLEPADSEQVNGPGQLFKTTLDTGGGQGVHSTGVNGGWAQRLTRLRADHARQDTTVYVDFDTFASNAHVEFWSDGSYHGNSGAGLLVQVQADGTIRFYLRIGRALAAQNGPTLPASGRIRIRAIKGAADTSEVHIDAWENNDWALDYALFAIADDRELLGRDVTVPVYGTSLRSIKRITAVHAAPAETLSIRHSEARSADWKVFQRNVLDMANVPIDVVYRDDEAVRLEARVVTATNDLPLADHDWGVHSVDLLPAPNSARASISIADVPTGGNYHVELRLIAIETAEERGTAKLDSIAVGDVYLCIGQSNMSGRGAFTANETMPTPLVHAFTNSDLWTQAKEPVDDGEFQRDRVSLDGPRHSLMLAFGKAMSDVTGVPVALIPAPRGGTNLYRQWQRNEEHHADAGTLYGSALRRVLAQNLGAPIRGMLWYQGESDAIASRSAAQYRQDLEQLAAQYREDLGAPDAYFHCVQLATWNSGGFPHWTNVQEGQRLFARFDARATLTTATDLAWSDGIHLTESGYQTLGARIAFAARVLEFGEVGDPLTELTEAVTMSAGPATGSEIELRYDAAISGGEVALYEVTDDSGIVPITSVAASGSVVTLTLERTVVGDVAVRYGMSRNAGASWVLDGAGVAVPCFAAVPVN